MLLFLSETLESNGIIKKQATNHLKLNIKKKWAEKDWRPLYSYKTIPHRFLACKYHPKLITYVHCHYIKMKMDKQASCMRWEYLVRLFILPLSNINLAGDKLSKKIKRGKVLFSQFRKWVREREVATSVRQRVSTTSAYEMVGDRLLVEVILSMLSIY